MSPLLPCPRLGADMGLSDLIIKDEGQLPTGSFKSRGMTMAVSMAHHFGTKRVAIPTAGNAGGAIAASTQLAVDIDAWNPPAQLIEPDPSTAATYDDLYALYRDLYPDTLSIAHPLATRQRRTS